MAICVLLPGCATSHMYVPAGLFATQDFVIGHGPSIESASADAKRAVPGDYELEWPRGGIGCTATDESAEWNPKSQLSECKKGYYNVLPVLPKDPKRKAEILKYREQERKTGQEFKGQGKTTDDATQDLLAKLPKDAVIDSWGISCTKEISIHNENGYSFCDSSIPGNQREVSTRVRAPNARSMLLGE